MAQQVSSKPIARPSFDIWTQFMHGGDTIYVAKVQVSALGFAQQTSYRDICEAAKVAGLDLCPRAGNFAFARHWSGMAESEVLQYASEPYGDGKSPWIPRFTWVGGHIVGGSAPCDETTLFKSTDLFVFRMP